MKKLLIAVLLCVGAQGVMANCGPNPDCQPGFTCNNGFCESGGGDSGNRPSGASGTPTNCPAGSDQCKSNNDCYKKCGVKGGQCFTETCNCQCNVG